MAPRAAPRRASGRSAGGAARAITLPATPSDEHGPDEMRAAALVLPGPRLVVLVGADRDVLRPVVGGQLAAADRDRGGRERDGRGEELLRGRRERVRVPEPAGRRCRAEQRARHAGPLVREPGVGKRAAQDREQREDLGEPRGTAEEVDLDVGGPKRLATRGDAELTLLRADGAAPVARPVHEHAVLERHPTEANLFGHAASVRTDRGVPAGQVVPRDSLLLAVNATPTGTEIWASGKQQAVTSVAPSVRRARRRRGRLRRGSASRARGRPQGSARPRNGRAARLPRTTSSGWGRSRMRSCRRPRAGSGCP